jgi:excisionase family DNA binding protein
LARQDAAKLTGYSVKTISRWVRSGKLRTFGLRGDRVKRSDLERLMAELPSQGTDGDGIIEAEESVALRILGGQRSRKGNR